MDKNETLNKIIESNEFVVSEVEKMRVLYGLKKEIRYDHERIHESHTESVAEHIYAMHCLIDYFLPLENPDGDWDALKIHKIAQYHDIDEIETGDIVSYKKTANDYEKEREALEIVINKLPESLQSQIKDLLIEYELQETMEAKFVKAIDKIEPVFHMYCKDGKKWLNKTKITRDIHIGIKEKYLGDFSVIKRVNSVMGDVYEKEGFYYQES